MRIVKEKEDLMVLRDEGIITFLVGPVFLTVGIVFLIKEGFSPIEPSSWIYLLFIFVGILITVLWKTTTISLDKKTGKLIFLSKGLKGKTSKEYNLNEIKEIELHTEYLKNKDNESNVFYNLIFILKSGERVPLSPGERGSRRSMGVQVIPEVDIGKKLAKFLEVPFQERRLPTVQETLSAVASAVLSIFNKNKK